MTVYDVFLKWRKEKNINSFSELYLNVNIVVSFGNPEFSSLLSFFIFLINVVSMSVILLKLFLEIYAYGSYRKLQPRMNNSHHYMLVE